MLPAFSVKEDSPVIDGMALIKDSRLVGYLDQEYAEYYQMAADILNNATFSFAIDESSSFNT